MAYYDSIGKLLDGGYRFTEIWSGTNPTNVTLVGTTQGFQPGDIIMMGFTYSNVHYTVPVVTYISNLKITGTKTIFNCNKIIPNINTNITGSWWNHEGGSLSVYIGLVLENAITIKCNISSNGTTGAYATKLYKLGKTS